MLPNEDDYLCATIHFTLISHTHHLISNMYLGPSASNQSVSDAGNDLDSLVGVDLHHLDLTPSVSFEFVASPHFVDLTSSSSL